MDLFVLKLLLGMLLFEVDLICSAVYYSVYVPNVVPIVSNGTFKCLFDFLLRNNCSSRHDVDSTGTSVAWKNKQKIKKIPEN